jgi:SAM-dependent methyltransferase
MVERAKYLWQDRGRQLEFERLGLQASILDDLSRPRLWNLGLSSQTRCLELGPGTGSMTGWMVAQGWSVLAIDLSDEFFPGFAGDGIELRTGDIRDVELTEEFDLIFARNVLHHLPERGDVVKKLAGALRPGGWIVAEDPVVELMRTLGGGDAMTFFREGIDAVFAKRGIDFNCGKHLPSLFIGAGLVDVEAAGGFSLAFDGSPVVDYLTMSLDLFEEGLLPLGEYSKNDYEALRAHVAGEDFVGMSPAIVSCRGRRAT